LSDLNPNSVDINTGNTKRNRLKRGVRREVSLLKSRLRKTAFTYCTVWGNVHAFALPVCLTLGMGTPNIEHWRALALK